MRFEEIGLGNAAPTVVNSVVEIPKGSSNKYEVDSETGLVKLDRVLYSPFYYPWDYGYILGTMYGDGDPLDVLILSSHPTFPGCIVEARPIGILGMRDEKGRDDKVIAACHRDPRFADVNELEDIAEHIRKEIYHFFEVYKDLEEKQVEVLGWESASTARELIMQHRA